jgi:hypothetical protein
MVYKPTPTKRVSVILMKREEVDSVNKAGWKNNLVNVGGCWAGYVEVPRECLKRLSL